VGDRPWILAGLGVFVVLVTVPFWANHAVGAAARGPGLVLPAGEAQCVLPNDAMVASHVGLLLQWEHEMDTDVLERHHTFTASNGRHYAISVERTCLGCHGTAASSSAEGFCTQCHSYVGAAAPSCLSCHQDAGVRAGAP
jgi:hypothetical protein